MKQILPILICVVFFGKTSAQSLPASLLESLQSDAAILAEEYNRPLGKSITYSLNAGWASSAKTHKKLGFDLTIGVAAPFVPESAETFSPEGLTYVPSPPSSMPTIFGDGTSTTLNVVVPIEGQPDLSGDLEFPGGVKDELSGNTLPIPYVQAGLGLFFDTDLLVRYIPETESQGASYNLFGLGFKHNLMQYFGPLDKLPLNVALLAAFTQTEFTYTLPGANNHQLDFDANAYTVQALASVDLPIISVFAGVGYNAGTSNLKDFGVYEIDPMPVPLPNPIELSYETTGMMGLVGMRMNLLFLKIFANYTLQEYNTLSAGVSFNFR